MEGIEKLRKEIADKYQELSKERNVKINDKLLFYLIEWRIKLDTTEVGVFCHRRIRQQGIFGPRRLRDIMSASLQ